MKLTIFCAILLTILSGCATPDPIIHTETVTVQVPVKVPCINPADVPPKPTSTLRKDGDTKQLAASTAAYVYAMEQYANKADPLMRACSQPQPEKKDVP